MLASSTSANQSSFWRNDCEGSAGRMEQFIGPSVAPGPQFSFPKESMGPHRFMVKQASSPLFWNIPPFFKAQSQILQAE